MLGLHSEEYYPDNHNMNDNNIISSHEDVQHENDAIVALLIHNLSEYEVNKIDEERKKKSNSQPEYTKKYGDIKKDMREDFNTFNGSVY